MKRGFGLLLLLLVLGSAFKLFWSKAPTGQAGELERLGRVPATAQRGTRDGDRVWQAAERASWWGKPLDPKQFWKDRAVWYDDSAQDIAQRHGRTYPPIPLHLTNLTEGSGFRRYDQTEKVGRPWDAGIDGGIVFPYHYTDAEREYWMWTLMTTKPKPPAYLEGVQLSVAATLRLRGAAPAPTGTYSQAIEKQRAQQAGMPPEALTEDALFWAYVVKKRTEYAQEQRRAADWQASGQPLPSGFFDPFWAHVAVDRALVTNALAAQEVKAANAWKSAYLQRLRREKTSDAYINAYLKAWNLSPAEVFHEDQHQ